MRPVLTYEEAFIRDYYAAILEQKRQASRLRPPTSIAATRMYHAAKASRLTTGFGSMQTSGDTELISSLRTLRARSREVIRDAGYAKRAKVIVVNNVVGSGIGMQAQVKTSRGGLNYRVNDEIESIWKEWSRAENCHTGGTLNFEDMEQFCMGQVFEAGEIFIRKHRRVFGNSPIPYALEVIEPERVLDEFQPSPVDPGMKVKLGVEMDVFHRPVAYWIRTIHPGDIRMNAWDVYKIERVPAEDIIHLRIVDRWPQTRGVPWMHTALRKLNDLDGYTEAEIIRARDQASISKALKTDRPYGTEVTDAQGNITRELVNEPGITEVLYDGEEMQYPAPSAPNSSADPFLRFMLREIAAGTGPSYGALSRDRSQGTYSSERQDLLDDRDLWRMYQMWFIRSLRVNIHNDFIQQGVLKRSLMTIPIEEYALNPRKFAAVRFKPRGWSWIDPAKEEGAFASGVKDGFTTLTDVIAKTADGRDIEDILEERAQELVLKKDVETRYGVKISFDTDPEFAGGKAAEGQEQGAGGKGTEGQSGGDEASVNFENLKQKMDAYGVGVRAGAITPQMEDEARFREESGLPSMTSAVKGAWRKDGNVRRPITLQSADGSRPAPGQAAPKEPGAPVEE